MVGRNTSSSSRGRLGLSLVLWLNACGNLEQAKEVDRSNGGESALQPSGPDPTAPSCDEYCDKVMSACDREHAVYASRALCLAVCALLDVGDAVEPVGNTLACRVMHAKLAERDPDVECSAAGPGGGNRCGSDCEAYCALYAQVCPEEAGAQARDVAQCVTSCGALVDQQSFDVTRDHGGDTIECRLVHVSAASVAAIPHCEHARLEATVPWCVDAD